MTDHFDLPLPEGVTLLPCPFCNWPRVSLCSSPRFGEEHAHEAGGIAFFVCCSSCAAQGGWAKSEKRAVEHWNRREGSDKQQDHLGEIERELSDLHRRHSEVVAEVLGHRLAEFGRQSRLAELEQTVLALRDRAEKAEAQIKNALAEADRLDEAWGDVPSEVEG